MSIDRISLTHVRIPLVEPFRISNGVVTEKDGIIVRVHADGLVGCGEASPMGGSFYSVDTPDSVWDALRQTIVPAVIARQPEDAAQANNLLQGLGGSPFALAGVETAFMELDALRRNEPLFRTLGGKEKSVECGLAMGIYESIDELLRSIDRHADLGYKRVKIKIQPGWDREPLHEIRKRFGSIPLMVDANCAYTRQDIDHLRTLDEFDLMMIEQPLAREDLDGHAMLQSVISTPVCLDESAENIDQVTEAIRKGSCKIVNIKIQRVGGLANALAVHDVCAEMGVPVWAGTMPELGIGGAQTVHLATLANFTFPTDVEASTRWFVEDIIDPAIDVHDGMITIPVGTGNCYRLREDILEKYSVREELFISEHRTA
ncbi:MAG: o-succinylbenzoate synthase [Ignavibacteria bacterium]|nr:o-succinylbenzoate synthase [Ignavibacteria bacterium]